MATTIDDGVLKDVVKQALLELFRERPAEMRDLFEEAVEDLGLVRAIQEGEATDIIPWEEVERTLRGDE